MKPQRDPSTRICIAYSRVLLSAILLLILGACSRSESRPAYRIGFSQCADDAWRMKMNREMLREKNFYENVSLEIRTANASNAQQIADIRHFIDQKVDLLVVSPNTSEALVSVIEEAHNAGIKIIVADRKVFTDSFDAFVGANNYQIGQAVGSYVQSLLSEGGCVVEITGNMASSPAVERHNGFLSVIRNSDKAIRLIGTSDGRWLQDSAFECMLSLLHTHPRIDVVFAHNDEMALAAWNAARTLGREKKIRFIGIDALHGKKNGVGLVADNILTATFQYPAGAEEIFRIAMDLLHGEQVPRETTLGTMVIDKKNVRVMELQGDYISQQDKKIEFLNDKIDLYTESYNLQHRFLLLSCLLIAIIVVVLLFLALALRSKNRLNRQLIEQNGSISAQKIQLEEQRDKLIELSRQVEESSQNKLRFFTNISHEFRTPLTLIADPLKRLMSDKEPEENRRYLLKLIDRNVEILLRLVNQILEFRRYENGYLEITPTRVNFREKIEGWNESFLHLFGSKRIRFDFAFAAEEDYTISLDLYQAEQIYYNLLHNAGKYTPEQGEIKVTLSRGNDCEDTYLQLEIFNSGSVIPKESLDKIFDRFYQLQDQQMGTGIGLAIVRAYVDLHGGTITASSTEGVGTTFTLRLPVGLDESTPPHETTSIESVAQPTENQDKPLLLVIDDNQDVCSYVRRLYKSHFLILSACDGIEGLNIARNSLPDIILLDVMMPNMDGLECCRQLKQDIRTCHIPVILLTARSEEGHRIEGYECGADSYITKPFSSVVLSARIHNLLENRRRMQHRTPTDEFFNQEIKGQEQEYAFIVKLNQYIMANIDNPSLEVEAIGKHMALSRMQFYRKIKTLTGYSPNEYVRVVRLKRAATLLRNTHKNISEVCYETGFSSPSYFSKCFKSYMGESPNDFKRRFCHDDPAPFEEMQV